MTFSVSRENGTDPPTKPRRCNFSFAGEKADERRPRASLRQCRPKSIPKRFGRGAAPEWRPRGHCRACKQRNPSFEDMQLGLKSRPRKQPPGLRNRSPAYKSPVLSATWRKIFRKKEIFRKVHRSSNSLRKRSLWAKIIVWISTNYFSETSDIS